MIGRLRAEYQGNPARDVDSWIKNLLIDPVVPKTPPNLLNPYNRRRYLSRDILK